MLIATYRAYFKEKEGDDPKPKDVIYEDKPESEGELSTNTKELIAERIMQLDNLYSVVKSLRFKALILSQTLSLVKKIEPEFLNDFKMSLFDPIENKQLIYKGSNVARAIAILAYQYEGNPNANPNPSEIALLILKMDSIRAGILTMLVEKGLIKKFKEIPVAIAKEDKEVDIRDLEQFD